MPSLYNPVGGLIHPVGWARPAGDLSWKVTSTFAQHVASGRGPGIDFGDTRCGDPVYAMAAGTVSLSGLIGTALVVRIVHPQFSPEFGGRKVESGYAHLNSALVKVGQTVAVGQQIGVHGKTGATACHLHGGFKVYGSGGPGDEVDFWPFLYQNKGGWVASSGVNVRSSVGSGSTMGPVFASSKPDGYLHRASDNKNLGASLTKRGIRQPIVGASYSLDGANGNRWLPIWLDGGFRYVALPLARTT